MNYAVVIVLAYSLCQFSYSSHHSTISLFHIYQQSVSGAPPPYILYGRENKCVMSSITIPLLSPPQVRGLYKGVLPPVLAQGAINAIVFGVEGPTNRFLQTRLREEPSKEVKIGFLAGMVGGFVQSFVCTPVELVKLITQHTAVGEASVYRGNWETLRLLYRRGGLAGCYQGFWVTAFRDTPAFGVYFASYYWMTNYFAKRKGITREELSEMMLYPFFCGGVTGMITWTVNYPVDLVKTRIQLDGTDGNPRQYKSSWNCFVKAWREGEVRLLYRRLVPYYGESFCNG